MRIRTAESLAFAAVLAGAFAACRATRAELDPRFALVHNTLASLGLAQVGPLQQGTLAEGGEARLVVELGAQCTTVAAIGGEGVRDVDLVVLDPKGAPLARDATRTPEAIVRACADAAGPYTLVVKMAAGAGDFVVGTWSGAPAAAVTAQVTAGDGTCASPHPFAVGAVSGSNAHGSEDSEGEGDCDGSRGKEVIYRLELPTKKRLVVDVEARFDTLVYVRRDDCVDGEQVACNDDAPNSSARQPPSHLEAVLDPGVYWVFVDSHGDSGSYRMATKLEDVPTLADACKLARPLAAGAPAHGSWANGFDHARSSCGEEAKGRDVAYRFELGGRSRVRVALHSDDAAPVVHVRRACTDAASEIGCSDSAGADSEAAFVGVLEAGQYSVFADSQDVDQEGRFQLSAEIAPEQGVGVSGDGCADAQVIAKGAKDLQGDTFEAKDDVAGTCGGAGAPDVVYRLDVARRTRIVARTGMQDGEHVLVLQKTCGDKRTELACDANGVDVTVEPGAYFLAVDGAKPDAFGRFDVEVRTREVALQDGACKAPPELKPGVAVTGTTVGAGDKFVSSCAGREDAQASADKVYRVVVAKRTHARLALSTPSYDGVLSLRRSCLDPPGAVSGRAAELTCNNDADDSHHSRVDTVLEAGTYFVVVEGFGAGQEGPYTLEYTATPVQ